MQNFELIEISMWDGSIPAILAPYLYFEFVFDLPKCRNIQVIAVVIEVA